MTRGEVFERVVAIMRMTFEASDVEIHDRTTATDVDGWDSLAHATLIVRIEKRFNVSVPDAVAYHASNVGELVDGICAVVGQ